MTRLTVTSPSSWEYWTETVGVMVDMLLKKQILRFAQDDRGGTRRPNGGQGTNEGREANGGQGGDNDYLASG